jgi:hypothetical protein
MAIKQNLQQSLVSGKTFLKTLQIKLKIEIHVISVMFVNCVTETEVTEFIEPNVNWKTYSPLTSEREGGGGGH